MIVRVNEVLNRTVVVVVVDSDRGFDNLCGSHLQSQSELYHVSKIPFLDCLVTRDNNKLQTTIYRKPTDTNRLLLDQSSYNATSHKATTIWTLS